MKNFKFPSIYLITSKFKKGFTITELIVAVGIMVTLASIGTLFYLKYYEKGKFTKIHKTAENFSSAVQICLLKHDTDPTKCAFFNTLKFNCDYCASTVWFRPGTPNTPGDLGDSFKIDITVDEFRTTVVYRLVANPSLIVRIQRTGTTQKFCALQNTLYGLNGYGISKPTRKCDINGDCETGEVCYLFPLTDWGGGGSWQVIPP